MLTAYCPLHTATGIAVPYLIDGYNLLFADLENDPNLKKLSDPHGPS